MSRVACRSCQNRFDEGDLTKLPFGGLICDACMQRECKMMDREMMNMDDTSLFESDDESSFSWDEKNNETNPCSSSSLSFQENNKIKLSEITQLKTVDDLIRYVVDVNYEEERLLPPQNSSNKNDNLKEADILLIRYFMSNQEPSVSISKYKTDLRSKLEEQTRNDFNTSSTTSIESSCSINEIDSNCSSAPIDKPKLMIDTLRKSCEFDSIKENMSVNKFTYPIFEIDLKIIRFN